MRNNNKRGQGYQPTLVLRTHTLINQNITGVNIKQVNIIPTASIFSADILNQIKDY
jgi:hypothetical protein